MLNFIYILFILCNDQLINIVLDVIKTNSLHGHEQTITQLLSSIEVETLDHCKFTKADGIYYYKYYYFSIYFNFNKV